MNGRNRITQFGCLYTMNILIQSCFNGRRPFISSCMECALYRSISDGFGGKSNIPDSYFLNFVRQAVKKMFEKSIQSMNNIDPADNEHPETSVKARPNESNSSASSPSPSTSRNGFNRKSNGNTAAKDRSKPTCTVS